MRVLRLALVWLLAGGTIAAQPTAGPVTIDVIVEGALRGGPLGPRDFDVSDGAGPLVVDAVTTFQPSADRAPLPVITNDADEEAAADAADHLVAVYIDEYHLVEDEAYASARRALANFVRHGLGPRDLVVVLKPLDSVVSIRLQSDREHAASTVEQAAARQGDYTARSAFEQNFLAGAPDRIDIARNQIVLSGISALAAHLGQFKGRKTLIVVSNGLTPLTPGVRSEQARGGLESIARTANRGNVAIYAVRPTPGHASPVRDIASGTSATAADPLAMLATGTTGFTIDGAGGLTSGFQRVLADLRRHYLLTITPRAGAADGRFRTLTVRLRRSGVEARARAGFAVRLPEPPDRTNGTRPVPEGLRVPRHTSALIRAWFGQLPASDGSVQTQVDFVWEPAPRRAGDRASQAVPARVVMSVTTMDGTPVYSGESVPTGRDTVAPASAQPQLSFTAAPGRLLVRMDILDVAGRVLDQDVRDLTIATFTRPVSFGTAVVYRARTVRDLRSVLESAPGISPVVSRQFSRAEHLVIRIPVVTALGQPEVSAHLQSGFGGPLRSLVVTPLGSDSRYVQVDFPLASLASGPYAVEFTARAGASSAVDRFEFVVTP